ncbi:MAG: S-layer homology domain-containing protein, partial [Butyricicoccus sp.]
MKTGKRFFSILLALVMVVTLLPAPRAQAADFRDIEGHWARNNIADAVERGLFSGTSDNTFSPNAPMTRAMFVTVLYRMDDGIALGDSYFIDVDEDAWYYDAVCWASENELVAGTDTWHFSPNQNITREQMVAILYRYLDYANATLERTTNVRPLFYDRGKISSYAQKAVEEMQFAEIIRGRPSGAGYNFDPQGKATRAEAARVFCLFIDQIIWGEEELTSEEAAERMGDILADEELDDIAENWRAADTDAERESYAEEIIEYFETLKDMGEIDVLQVDRDNQTISYRIGKLEGAYLLYDQAEHVVDTSDITFDFSGAASGSLVRDVYGSTGPVYG